MKDYNERRNDCRVYCGRVPGLVDMTTARTVRTVEKGDWRAVFLAALATSGVVLTACKKARIGRTTAYKTRDEDEEFRLAWDAALDDAADGMEEEAHRRAVTGVLKPVYQGGKKVGSIREYSDTLLIFRLKAARPEKYRERHEVDHKGKIEVEYVNNWRAPD